MRIPEEVYEQSRRLAMLKGIPHGQILAEAFDQWLALHADELADQLEAFARQIRERREPS